MLTQIANKQLQRAHKVLSATKRVLAFGRGGPQVASSTQDSRIFSEDFCLAALFFLFRRSWWLVRHFLEWFAPD